MFFGLVISDVHYEEQGWRLAEIEMNPIGNVAQGLMNTGETSENDSSSSNDSSNQSSMSDSSSGEKLIK